MKLRVSFGRAACIRSLACAMEGTSSPRFASLRAVVLAVAMLVAVSIPANALADSGSVYSCTVVPSYRHPATGVIEDVGGESSFATGQGMVESCISSRGMLEMSDSGAVYLTVRLGLMDYTSNHSFLVQDWGDSGWSEPQLAVTATGSDANGATQDVCVAVPSSQCILRITMYVEPMGRDVVCFCYPKDFVSGQPDDMTPAAVTEAPQPSAEEVVAAQESAEGIVEQESAEPAAVQVDAEEDDAQAPIPDGEVEQETIADAVVSDQAGASAAQAPPQAPAEPDDGAVSAQASAEDELVNQGIGAAQGLSLSTADGAAAGLALSDAGRGSVGVAVPAEAVVVIWSMAAGGAIVLFVAVVGLFLLRRDFSRLLGVDPDDYSSAYGDDDA